MLTEPTGTRSGVRRTAGLTDARKLSTILVVVEGFYDYCDGGLKGRLWNIVPPPCFLFGRMDKHALVAACAHSGHPLSTDLASLSFTTALSAAGGN